MTVHIRSMVADDASSVSALMPDLGYQATPAELAHRLARLREWPDQEAFVLTWHSAVVGLSQVQGVRLLASDGYAEVQALVIARAHQGRGLGASLLRHTVAWAFARGYPRVRLRSGVHREAAHRFYRAQGFTQARASYAFECSAPECD
jgi:GNAT superfamily N-acetyltransferase